MRTEETPGKSPKKIADDCPATRLAWFLSRHPWLDWLGRTFMDSVFAAPVVAGIAWGLRRFARRESPRAVVDAFAFDGATATDFEGRLLARLTYTEAARDRVAAFLSDLSTLHPKTKAGLRRAWVHAVGATFIHREKLRFVDRRDGVVRFHPLDAIVAAFGACNLSCQGCYAAPELGGVGAKAADLDFILRELRRHHVAHVFLAGKGEPFFDRASRALLFGTARRHRQLIFSVYTNGTTMDASDVARLRKSPNLIPLISVDGPRGVNDDRRGVGTFDKATRAMRLLNEAGLLFGFVSTVFKGNQAAVLASEFLREMRECGCRFGGYSVFFSGDPLLAAAMGLNQAERDAFAEALSVAQVASPLPLLDLDGAEAHVGCRARHGATLYIDAITGQVAPCIRDPKSPPDCSLFLNRRPGRLAEILAADFFRAYRAVDKHTCPAFDVVAPELIPLRVPGAACAPPSHFRLP